MKRFLYLILGLGLLPIDCATKTSLTSSTPTQEETEQPQAAIGGAPFTKGVNFSGWFESFSAQSIPFTKYAKEDFANVKSLGADVIRLPIRMHSMTIGKPPFTLDPLLLQFLDTAIGWAEKYQLYIIVDNHSFDPVEHTADNIDTILVPVWAQIAQRYKDRGKYIIYEILNEPHGISDERWGEIQRQVIEAIRKIDKKHAIIVGGTNFNALDKLSALPKYSDQNLIYTFHFYDPFLFTHQGASWGDPPVLTNLAQVPFPADRKRVPKIPADLKGTWIESSLRSGYFKDATPIKLYETLDKAVAFSKERNVPVFCGEFGVYMIQSPAADRVVWYKTVADALDRRNIARTSWDYYGGFGLFNKKSGGDFYADLNAEVALAMGFTPPPQRTQPHPLAALTNGVTLYDDYPNRNYPVEYWGKDGGLGLYDTKAAKGQFAIKWTMADRYDLFYFIFEHGKDLSALVKTGKLEFMARAEKPVRFDVRFKNTETASSVPWRMRYTIDETLLPPDGKWHSISIPFNEMREHGAWVDAKQKWLEPQGKFSWENIERLEFVSEYENMKNQTIWFDSVKITVE
jgi:endoglucanase